MKKTRKGDTGIVKCFLCDAVIPAKDAEELYCKGCERHICDDHDAKVSREHDPEEHDEEDEEE